MIIDHSFNFIHEIENKKVTKKYNYHPFIDYIEFNYSDETN